MKRQNSHPNEFDFLLPLKKRNDLEPDPDFVVSLKNRISVDSSKTKNLAGKLRIALATSLALFTFSVLAFSFLDSITTKKELSLSEEGRVPAAEVPTNTSAETPSYDFGQLLKENPHYQELYQTLSKAIQSEKGSEAFILYLHALKQKDMDEIKKHAFTSIDSDIEELIETYNKINYETITIDKTTPSKAEPSVEVQLSYQLNGSKNKEARTIHININDETDINIYEADLKK